MYYINIKEAGEEEKKKEKKTDVKNKKNTCNSHVMTRMAYCKLV